MRAGASFIAIITLILPTVVAAKPSSLWVESVGTPPKKVAARPKSRPLPPRNDFTLPQRSELYAPRETPSPAVSAGHEETIEFLGFNANESAAAFKVKVIESTGAKTRAYEVIRLVSTQNEQTVATFQQGAPSPAGEWQAAKPETMCSAYAARANLWMCSIHHARHIFRVAIDPRDKVADSLSTKKCITITGAEGSGLGMTPVIRLYDGRIVPFDPLPRANGQRGQSAGVVLTAYHSHTGMHVAVVASYSGKNGGSTTGEQPQCGSLGAHTTDMTRIYAMPQVPVGTITIGSFNMTATSEKLGEQYFGELHPEFKEEFKRLGRD
jgi:hypothetical protein